MQNVLVLTVIKSIEVCISTHCPLVDMGCKDHCGKSGNKAFCPFINATNDLIMTKNVLKNLNLMSY